MLDEIINYVQSLQQQVEVCYFGTQLIGSQIVMRISTCKITMLIKPHDKLRLASVNEV